MQNLKPILHKLKSIKRINIFIHLDFIIEAVET